MVKRNPLVAVLMPSRNAGPFFHQCLSCLQNQSFQNFKVIIVDNSTDGSFEYLQTIVAKDVRFSVFRQHGKGVANARNQCLDVLEETQIPFFLFLDADDYLATDYINDMLAMQADTDADIVTSSFWEVKDGSVWAFRGNKEPRFRLLSGIDATKCLLEDREILSHLHGKLYRSSLWDGVRLKESINYCEDRGVLFIPFAKAKRIYVTNYLGYYYREDNANALCREPWHNTKILSTYYAYLESYFCDFSSFSANEQNELKVAALTGLFFVHLSLFPRFDFRGATSTETSEMRQILKVIKHSGFRGHCKALGKNERLKKTIYSISPALYRYLFRLRLRRIEKKV